MSQNNDKYAIYGSTLTGIADAIRTKNGTQETYLPSEMSEAILSIKGGGIEELPDNLAYLDQTIADKEFIGYGSSVTVDKTGADMGETNPILQALYPIGSIYMSVIHFNPATVFGGVWEQISGRFLLAADDTYAAGSTGGEAAHKLTANELPKITGSLTSSYGNAGENAGGYGAFRYSSGVISVSEVRQYGRPPEPAAWPSGLAYGTANLSFGGDAAHNNMPPYLAVYVWKRTA